MTDERREKITAVEKVITDVYKSLLELTEVQRTAWMVMPDCVLESRDGIDIYDAYENLTIALMSLDEVLEHLAGAKFKREEL